MTGDEMLVLSLEPAAAAGLPAFHGAYIAPLYPSQACRSPLPPPRFASSREAHSLPASSMDSSAALLSLAELRWYEGWGLVRAAAPHLLRPTRHLHVTRSGPPSFWHALYRAVLWRCFCMWGPAGCV